MKGQKHDRESNRKRQGHHQEGAKRRRAAPPALGADKADGKAPRARDTPRCRNGSRLGRAGSMRVIKAQRGQPLPKALCVRGLPAYAKDGKGRLLLPKARAHEEKKFKTRVGYATFASCHEGEPRRGANVGPTPTSALTGSDLTPTEARIRRSRVVRM